MWSVCLLPLCLYLFKGYNTTIETLRNISTATNTLVASGNMLSASLNTISSNLMAVAMTCQTLGAGCNVPDPSIFQTGANFSQVGNDLESRAGLTQESQHPVKLVEQSSTPMSTQTLIEIRPCQTSPGSNAGSCDHHMNGV